MKSLIEGQLLQLFRDLRRRYVGTVDPRQTTLRDALARGGFYVVQHSSERSIALQLYDRLWLDFNGTDAARLNQAALESIVPRSCEDYDDRIISWSVIAAYYSAFFSFQCLLRIMGKGLLYLNAHDCDLLSNAVGSIGRLQPGVYSITFERGANDILTLTKGNASGFHEFFWRYLDGVLEELASDISVGSHPVAGVFDQGLLLIFVRDIEALRDWLKNCNGEMRRAGWMSELRNDVNYRLARDCWGHNFAERGATNKGLRNSIRTILRGNRVNLERGMAIDRDVRQLLENSALACRAVNFVLSP